MYRCGVAVIEFAEDQARALTDDVRQHVQPTTVGHPQHNLINTMLAGPVDSQVEQRDQALSALQREPFRANVLLLNELLEHHRVGQPL